MQNVRLKHATLATDRSYSNEKPVWLQQHRGTAKENRPPFNACLGEAVDLTLDEARGATVWRDWHDMDNAQGHF
jgi:hypothetical protein